MQKLVIEVTVGQRVTVPSHGNAKGVVTAVRESPFPGEVDVKLDSGVMITVPVSIGPA